LLLLFLLSLLLLLSIVAAATAAFATFIIIIFIKANLKHFFYASKHCKSDIINQAHKMRSFLNSEQSMFCIPLPCPHFYATCPHYFHVLIIFLVVSTGFLTVAKYFNKWTQFNACMAMYGIHCRYSPEVAKYV
jgi:hypothetical protein